MITLIANSTTGTRVTRKEISHERAVSLFPELDEKMQQLSNSNNGFSLRGKDGGIDVLVRDWVAYKHSNFDVRHVDFTHYWFH